MEDWEPLRSALLGFKWQQPFLALSPKTALIKCGALSVGWPPRGVPFDELEMLFPVFKHRQIRQMLDKKEHLSSEGVDGLGCRGPNIDWWEAKGKPVIGGGFTLPLACLKTHSEARQRTSILGLSFLLSPGWLLRVALNKQF